MSRTRVLRVITRMNIGGPSLQLTALMKGLDAARFEHRVLAGTVADGEGDYLTMCEDLPVIRIPELGRTIRAARDVAALRRLVHEVRRFRPHIVHTHMSKAGLLGRLAARLCGVEATVHTFHGHLLYGHFSTQGTDALCRIERALARRTTALAAVGAAVRDELLAAGIGTADQYLVVPPGVQRPEPPDQLRARRLLGVPAQAPTVAYVSRQDPIKRPLRFAEVASRLAARHPDARFIVSGGGTLRPALEAALRPLGSRVRFLGWRTDVEVVHSAADVVVLTSDNEGMPVALIEAAMCGRAAVTTDVGSAREVVEDGATGFVTHTRHPAEIAAATSRLLADGDLRRSFGATARRRAHALFSAQRLVAVTELLYERLALGQGAGELLVPSAAG